MTKRWTHGCAGLLAGGLLIGAPVEVRCEPTSEPFEVVVVRGASVSRVTGTESGEVHEEVIREDPRPAEPTPEPEPEPTRSARRSDDAEPQQTVVVYVVRGSTTAYPIFVRDGHARGHGLRRHGIQPHPGVWRHTGSSPRMRYTGSRGGHRGHRGQHDSRR
ncbi:MAG: hypothetical protein ACYTGK_18465 [Planctomycetota bacterium]|jgi:hypothetical protein